MDGKGRATDNAIVERFFRTIKQECIYLNPTVKVKELKNLSLEKIKYLNITEQLYAMKLKPVLGVH